MKKTRAVRRGSITLVNDGNAINFLTNFRTRGGRFLANELTDRVAEGVRDDIRFATGVVLDVRSGRTKRRSIGRANLVTKKWYHVFLFGSVAHTIARVRGLVGRVDRLPARAGVPSTSKFLARPSRNTKSTGSVLKFSLSRSFGAAKGGFGYAKMLWHPGIATIYSGSRFDKSAASNFARHAGRVVAEVIGKYVKN